MNPLTNVKNILKLNERELNLGVKDSTSWHQQYKDSAWVFVGGLDYKFTEGDIICVMSQYGEIVAVNLVRDHKTGKSKGFAFLCYEDQRSTILAVDNLNSAKLSGRTIRVDHVEEYKVPKMREDMDPERMRLTLEGCAPKPVQQDVKEKEEEEEDIKPSIAQEKTKPKKSKSAKKKVKKEKKKSSKKKKKAKKRSPSPDTSSSSDSEADKSDNSIKILDVKMGTTKQQSTTSISYNERNGPVRYTNGRHMSTDIDNIKEENIFHKSHEDNMRNDTHRYMHNDMHRFRGRGVPYRRRPMYGRHYNRPSNYSHQYYERNNRQENYNDKSRPRSTSRY